MELQARRQAPPLEATNQNDRYDQSDQAHPAPDGISPPRTSRLPALRLLSGLQPRQFWAMLGAAAAVMSARPGPASTATALPSPTVIPTPLPAHPLSWQPGTAPIRLVREVDPPELKLPPADGRVAYLCASPPTETPGVEPQVWVTQDWGAHWTTISTIPLSHHYNGCHLLANDTNPASAVVTMTHYSADPNATLVDDFATFDYRHSWTQIGPPDGGHAVQVASTRDGKTVYVLRTWIDGDVVQMQLSRVPVGGLNDWIGQHSESRP